jgi:fructose-1,6-bisphosphatase I
MYPGTVKKPEGKLRLLYETAPLAFLIEQAGGLASTGTEEILDVVPDQLHTRTPVIIGSKDDVTLVKSFISDRKHEKNAAIASH